MLGLAEYSQHMTAITKLRQRARQSKVKKQKLTEVESEASRPQSIPWNSKAKARGKQNEEKNSHSEVTTPCHFGTGRRLQNLANSSKESFCSCLDMSRPSVIDSAYITHLTCMRLTLCMRTPSITAVCRDLSN